MLELPFVDPVGEIKDLADFVSKLAAGGLTLGDPPLWYRGCSNVTHSLVPGVFRPPREGHNEKMLLKRYMQDAHFLLAEPPANEWEWVFSAQHHGVPTRLLDWSENPLVGLFFAAQPQSDQVDDPEPPGALWVLTPDGLNSHALNEDRVDLPLFSVDPQLDLYAPLTSAPTSTHLKPAAGMAMRSFLRIAAQWGCFTVHTNSTALDDEPFSATVVRKFLVPAEAKKSIRSDLAVLGVEERTVYPDLHHLGQSIKGRF